MVTGKVSPYTMARPTDPERLDRIIAEWRTGEYS